MFMVYGEGTPLTPRERDHILNLFREPQREISKGQVAGELPTREELRQASGSNFLFDRCFPFVIPKEETAKMIEVNEGNSANEIFNGCFPFPIA